MTIMEHIETRDKMRDVIGTALKDSAAELNLGIDGKKIRELYDKCFATRGKYRGWLKNRKPSDESVSAVWLAIIGNANPHKLNVGAILFLSEDSRELYNRLDNFFTTKIVRQAISRLDRDRVLITLMGGW